MLIPYRFVFPTTREKAIFYVGLYDAGQRETPIPEFNNPLFHQQVIAENQRFMTYVAVIGDYLFHYEHNDGVDIANSLESFILREISDQAYNQLIKAMYMAMNRIAGSRFHRVWRRMGFGKPRFALNWSCFPMLSWLYG